MASPPPRWVLLIHQIPPKPDYLRVKVARRLQRIGAVAIKNSVYVLPAAPSTIEDFQWLLREISADGGEASVCEATFVDGLADPDVEGLFHAARGSEYDDIARQAARTLKITAPSKALSSERQGQIRSEATRLKRRLAAVTAIDFFGSPQRAAAEEAVGLLEVRHRTTASRDAPTGSALRHPERPDPRSVRGRTWVTREGVFVDRIGSAWLIRRFIDPEARFGFAPAEGYAPSPGELRFDMFEAEFTHEGDRCTFETLLRWFNLQTDPALREIAEIIHDIDVKDGKFGRAEAPGLERLLAGVARRESMDIDRVERGAALFDALYDAFQADAERTRTPKRAPTPKAHAGHPRRRKR
jgi:hypothetical protein